MLKKILLSLVILSTQSIAGNNDIIKNLSPLFGVIDKQDIIKTPLDGIYEIIFKNPISSQFISADGKYLIKGDIINLKTLTPLDSSARVNALKKDLLDTISDKDKIIFKAKEEKYVIHVFTDVDCPFCKRLHQQMSKMNALGITVKYLASPLASLHPTAQGKMEKIWCAKDKAKAMNDYKIKNIVPDVKNCSNPVAQQLSLSQQLGVNGTPAIFLSDGTHIPGYMPAEKLLKTIKQKLGK
ncbi:Thiol:disulfide interchange protein DsbC [Bathymodiolus thermophilus thioautotrophic gill symbiont]|uniref:Thiol:disulfide interchange protein n=1 Tax=Bathymodiolus thermophilus thioautotrophic gill symbiont TaxID=2360 RepID=A0A1J5TWP0_9GAMM|nr:DsbC family protein [Bathymodiolus thermophilus thioautotrophic gill symbiont]AYQ57475.1 Thiol-disulfide interchange protein DsbC [Bathymodiolus thermophilus thioautotrophic gill symbiont]OIR25259.1 thiol:disulfide interchange protein [Bathymodiolus thermophilus thioautotrophic gill symbiont]CAB5503325.1 Thiol:disulfide interchange protein DsbC [Bathymodiolus thermophilus thioautotrophic gill symbiont]CAB5503617.1 Thiol:disulfide interchange protein DsbC [Bathymodiolus thermophilus thioautot